MNNLFNKIPENFFSVLSRKYKSVYALALLTLYETLRLYKTKIKKVDYMNLLYSRSHEMMDLFDLSIDRLDDREDEDRIEEIADEDATSPVKISYIVRKLEAAGWMETEKDVRTNTEYIFLPSYSIRMLELLNSLTSDLSFYLPLVHQTYSELKLEDEKEDDYMYRTVVNARKNAEELELSVTLLHHSICVFGHRLSNVFSPNEALHQHFDDYQTQISDRLYHPMKTYDSLGLYSLPTIAILSRWQRDDRLVGKMASQARLEPQNVGKSQGDLVSEVMRMIQDTVDIFNKLNSDFDDIDKANANYTEAVQKKVNYLSSSDKTVQGKIKAILVRAAKEIKEDSGDYENIPFLQSLNSTVSIYRQGYLDQDSLTMPFKRSSLQEDMEPAALQDPFDPSGESYDGSLEEEISRYGGEAVDDFMAAAFGTKDRVSTAEMHFADMDAFILFILATVRAELKLSFYRMERQEGSEIRTQGFILPDYVFVREES